jgi:dethiobiotin synthetase
MLIAITGTGTGIGKTHVACALVRAIGGAGFKPVESGGHEDGDRLRAASMFHVKQVPPYLFAAPVSPHLAARMEGRQIEVPKILAAVEAARREVSPLVVELAGGLFSPLAPGVTNAEILAALSPAITILVAPDRLGVLHDVAAVDRAAGSLITGIILSAPETPDASTGTNAAELPMVSKLKILASLPRAPEEELAPFLGALIR